MGKRKRNLSSNGKYYYYECQNRYNRNGFVVDSPNLRTLTLKVGTMCTRNIYKMKGLYVSSKVLIKIKMFKTKEKLSYFNT